MMKNTPTVSTVQKDILSRLLATEDIVVEHSNQVHTAMFDVKNRILILPLWKDMSSRLYDMLVGHEVGHALYTPLKDSKGRELPEIINDLAGSGGDVALVKGLLNVVEDARIERKMKIKFPGMRRDFIAGYKELHQDRDFFGLTDTNIDTLSLGDRINLHYKIGDLVTVNFADEEKRILNDIDNTESFDDVINVVRDLYDAIDSDEQITTQSEDAEDSDFGTPDNTEDGEAGENDVQVGTSNESGEDDSNPSESESTEENAPGDDSEDSGASMDDDTDDGESAESTKGQGDEEDEGDQDPETSSPSKELGTGLSTVDASEEVMESLRDNNQYRRDNMYVELADYDANNWIVEPSNTYKGLKTTQDSSQIKRELDRKVAKGANMLVKQFELKKAADTHKRTMISKTGILDTMKMINYKFSDDIFRRNATITEGKNHGIVCFIDWSGSMSTDMTATIEQLYMLATFCKKANIPFDFYAFSSITPWNERFCYDTGKHIDATDSPIKPLTDEATTGDRIQVQPSKDMCLYHLVSGEMKNREFTECMTNLALLHAYHDYNRTVSRPSHLSLGGTPLDDCVVLARDIVRQFREKHRLQIVHAVFLTDGCSHTGCLNRGTHLRDNRKNYELAECYGGHRTAQLMKWFRATADTGAIGIFLTSTPTTACRQALIQYKDQAAAKKQFKKEKFISGGQIHGYTEYFVLKSDTGIADNNFDEISSDVSTTRLRSAFMKSQTQMITSRTVLNRIAELIAE